MLFADAVHAGRIRLTLRLLLLCGIEEDFHVGLGGAEELLRPFESIAGGHVRVAGAGQEEVVLANDLNHPGVPQHPVDVLHDAADEEVTAICTQGSHQILQGHDGGGVHVAGIFQAQDDDAQVGVGAGLLDLGAEELRRTKEQLALDMNDGDGGVLPHAWLASAR
ncbi:hypothetical protein SAMN02745166_00358 [Prosthecobacter debontii]|uniref:Uncharacterized protein n=1 Tax=Prosthecobacter debontii TaxID=48467 RepID=A0A1T4WIX5_9BACT|nr:hypothetical protein SAMN02745166_00358 [Prosthecobacter debontii]